MPLATTLDIARSSLAVLTDQSAVVSRNVSQAGVAGATRKVVQLTAEPGYGPRVTGIERGVPEALQSRMLSARSDAARSSVVVSVLGELAAQNDPKFGIGARVGALASALQTYAARPSDFNLAAGAVAAAQDVASALRDGSAAVSRVREQAQADIVAAVADVNGQLSRLSELDKLIVNGSRSGKDITDELDERDRVMGRIAEQIGVSTVMRSDQGLSLFTDSGIPLYDGTVRSVTVKADPLLPGQPGGAVYVDGLQATGAASLMQIGSGRLAGLVELRDNVALTYAAQHDEIAALLVRGFAESDQGDPATLPPSAGLFRSAGSSSLPAAGVVPFGLASQIEVSPAVMPAHGGDVFKLRDGGISGAAYIYNADGASGFVTRLQELSGALSAPVEPAAEAQLPSAASIGALAAASSGWLDQTRKGLSEQSDFASALLDRATSALSDVAGVNIDQQITELLDLQRSYQASTKLISTVDNMFNALLQAI